MQSAALGAQQQTKRLESLTSLRFVAAFVVFVHHGAQHLPGTPLARWTDQGAGGVSFFFVLSGFVLTWSRSPGTPPLTFFRRRFARIYPAYLAGMVLFVVAAWRPLRTPQHAWILAIHASLLQSFVPVQRVFWGANPVTWSLSCEAFFYAVFPFIVGPILSLSDRARRQLAVVMVAIPVLIGVLVYAVGYKGLWVWFSYVSPPVRLAEFVLGIVLAIEVRSGSWPKVSTRFAVVVAAAAYLAAGFMPQPLRYVATMLVPICLLVGTVAANDLRGRAGRLLHQRWLVRLGVWSYGFYIVHHFVIRAVVTVVQRRQGYGMVPTTVGLALALLATLLVAAALHRVVEAPMERRLRGSPLG